MGFETYLWRQMKCIHITLFAFFVFFLIISRKNVKDHKFSVKGSIILSKQNTDSIRDDVMIEHLDWNNYSLIASDSKRTGLAEHGAGVTIHLNSEETIKRQKLLDKYQYDAYYSDRISLERSIGDIRPEACKRVKYIKDIPENSVSIIIPMFNEKNSTLLRTIHSIINRSPAILLKEVIVVDDFSQEDELKAPLDDYVREHFSKVKIIRNKQREGYTRSIIIGADTSTGPFLVILEPHMEVNYNYLPPLMEIILLNNKTIACPTIDSTARDFSIKPQVERTRGGFNWYFAHKRMPVTVPMDDVSPHASPIMMGGAFAISREWWDELGKYDPGMDERGAEHLELSVKSWLCGGGVVDSPCSRVTQLFREFRHGDSGRAKFSQNIARFAVAWMDGFREVVFQRMPQLREIAPATNILKQIELRKSLKCKSFDWFLTAVAPDILELFPISEPAPFASGHMISNYNSSLCAVLKDDSVYLADCSSEQIDIFIYDWRYHIVGPIGQCFYANHQGHLIVDMYRKSEFTDEQTFVWDPKSGHIVNSHSRLCIDFKVDSLQLFMSKCVKDKSSQSWKFVDALRVVEA